MWGGVGTVGRSRWTALRFGHCSCAQALLLSAQQACPTVRGCSIPMFSRQLTVLHVHCHTSNRRHVRGRGAARAGCGRLGAGQERGGGRQQRGRVWDRWVCCCIAGWSLRAQLCARLQLSAWSPGIQRWPPLAHAFRTSCCSCIRSLHDHHLPAGSGWDDGEDAGLRRRLWLQVARHVVQQVRGR